MSQNLTILYFIKRKKKKEGLVPIYLRVTINSRRFELSVNRKVDPDKWERKSGTVKGNSEEVKTLNQYLLQFKTNVLKQYNILISTGDEITEDVLKNRILGREKRVHKLIEIFTYHTDQMKQNLGKDYALGTYKRYLVSKGKLKKFLLQEYHSTDIDIEKLNYQFISNFELFLKTKENCCHNTAWNHIKSLKKIIKLAIANEWLPRNPFVNHKCTYKDPNREFLTQDELDCLIAKEFANKRLETVRDLFVFCCYTGLAYSDVAELKAEYISRDIQGNKWIRIYRHKTGERSSIPLLPIAEAIISKYENDSEYNCTGKLLPVISNQKMNSYLKEIANICKINKNIRTHCGRHTFSTTVTLTNGVPLETVSKMLGHRSIKTTQIYAKVTDLKILDDVQKLRTKLTTNEKKVAL